MKIKPFLLFFFYRRFCIHFLKEFLKFKNFFLEIHTVCSRNVKANIDVTFCINSCHSYSLFETENLSYIYQIKKA